MFAKHGGFRFSRPHEYGQTRIVGSCQLPLSPRGSTEKSIDMLLHEFMSSHRDEILASCYARLGETRARAACSSAISGFYDAILRSMRRDSGFPESSHTMPEVGKINARQNKSESVWVSAEDVPDIFLSIRNAILTTSQAYELGITGDEESVLNRCLDVGIAATLESCWRQAEAEPVPVGDRPNQLAQHLSDAWRNADVAWRLIRAGRLQADGRTGAVLEHNLEKMGALVARWGKGEDECGRSPVPTSVNVARILRDIGTSALPGRGVRSVLAIDEHLFVWVDELLFTSTVSTMFYDAVRHSQPRGIVRLSTYAEEDCAIIRFDNESDGELEESSGCSIAPRPIDGRTRSSPGFGLAIVQSAAAVMNGELLVEQRPGAGRAIMLRLPSLLLV